VPAVSATPVPTLPAPAATRAPSTPTPTDKPPATQQDLEAAAARLHQEAVVIDTHCDTVLRIVDTDTWLPRHSIRQETRHMVDIPKLQTGGIDVQVFASYTSGYLLADGKADYARANSRLLALLNGVHWTVTQNARSLTLIQSNADIEQAQQAGKIGVMASIEGAYAFSEQTGIELLRQYDDLGIRMLSLTWNYSNALGEGAEGIYLDGTASRGGLTDLGRSVIAEMNRLGIVIDVSHLNEATFWHVLAETRAPVIASHSSVYALCPHVRNLTDRQIQAIAGNGGVVQVNYHRPFLSADPDSATLATVVDHIDAVVALVGVDHVGLGSDFDGAKMPLGLEDAAKVPRITRELLSRGYSEADIRKILGANTRRLIQDVQASASVRPVGRGPALMPDLEAGQGLAGTQPKLSATLTLAPGQTLDPDSLAVVLDGIRYIPTYDEKTGTLSLTPAEPLIEKFHVVTFEAADRNGVSTRETRIFYLP
jgi:membrane dipeptidase